MTTLTRSNDARSRGAWLGAVLLAGCMSKGAAERPGQLTRTHDHAWASYGALVHVSGLKVLRFDLAELDDQDQRRLKQRVKLMLTMPDGWDEELDCRSAGLRVDGTAFPLEDAHFTHRRETVPQFTDGFVAVSTLLSLLPARRVELFWCGLELELSGSHVAEIAKFAQRVAS